MSFLSCETPANSVLISFMVLSTALARYTESPSDDDREIRTPGDEPTRPSVPHHPKRQLDLSTISGFPATNFPSVPGIHTAFPPLNTSFQTDYNRSTNGVIHSLPSTGLSFEPMPDQQGPHMNMDRKGILPETDNYALPYFWAEVVSGFFGVKREKSPFKVSGSEITISYFRLYLLVVRHTHGPRSQSSIIVRSGVF